jgi:hypothetical protein
MEHNERELLMSSKSWDSGAVLQIPQGSRKSAQTLLIQSVCGKFPRANPNPAADNLLGNLVRTAV